MVWTLTAIALMCSPGDRLVDFRTEIPISQKFIDILVTVQPAYTRFYIYQPGFPDKLQQCCGDKPAGVLHVPVLDGKFCIKQSQPQMKWRAQVILKPDLSL